MVGKFAHSSIDNTIHSYFSIIIFFESFPWVFLEHQLTWYTNVPWERSREKVWQPKIVGRGGLGEGGGKNHAPASKWRGGGFSLGGDSAVCGRRYGRGSRESSHDPVLSCQGWIPTPRLLQRHALSRPGCKSTSRGGGKSRKKEQQLIWPEKVPDHSGMNYSEIRSQARGKEPQNWAAQKVYIWGQCRRWSICTG